MPDALGSDVVRALLLGLPLPEWGRLRLLTKMLTGVSVEDRCTCDDRITPDALAAE
jgi:hypothetical protein